MCLIMYNANLRGKVAAQCYDSSWVPSAWRKNSLIALRMEGTLGCANSSALCILSDEIPPLSHSLWILRSFKMPFTPITSGTLLLSMNYSSRCTQQWCAVLSIFCWGQLSGKASQHLIEIPQLRMGLWVSYYLILCCSHKKRSACSAQCLIKRNDFSFWWTCRVFLKLLMNLRSWEDKILMGTKWNEKVEPRNNSH